MGKKCFITCNPHTFVVPSHGTTVARAIVPATHKQVERGSGQPYRLYRCGTNLVPLVESLSVCGVNLEIPRR